MGMVKYLSREHLDLMLASGHKGLYNLASNMAGASSNCND
jgi:hypothetical protein